MPATPKPADTLPNGTPKALTKQNFGDVYDLVTSLQHVAIQPFNEQLMVNDLFQSFLTQAEDYCVKKSSLSGMSVAVLKFRSIEYGDAAYVSMKDSFEDGHVKVFHPKANGEEDPSKILERKTVDLDYFTEGLFGHPEPLVDRLVVLEKVPESDQDELFTEFPHAVNIIDFTCDHAVKDAVVIEMKSKDAADALVQERNGSKYKKSVICASLLRSRIHVLSNKHANHVRKRDTTHSFLGDSERMARVREVLSLEQERNELGGRVDLVGLQKFFRYKEISKRHEELRQSLFTDARRRHEKNLKIPEEALPLSDDQRRVFSGKGVFAKKPATNGETKASTAVKRSGPPVTSEPPAKKLPPSGARMGRGGSARPQRPGLAPTSSEDQFIQSLAQRVQQLTDEVKAAGKDPTVKPKLDCIHGLGLTAKEDKFKGNPVVRAMTDRIRELQVMLGRKPDANEVIQQIQRRLAAKPLLELELPPARPLVPAMHDDMLGPGEFVEQGRGSLLGRPPIHPVARARGGYEQPGGYDSGYGDAPQDDVSATIGQLRAKLAELGSRLGTDAGMAREEVYDEMGDMGRRPMLAFSNTPAMGMQRGAAPRGMARGVNRGGRGAVMSRGRAW